MSDETTNAKPKATKKYRVPRAKSPTRTITISLTPEELNLVEGLIDYQRAQLAAQRLAYVPITLQGVAKSALMSAAIDVAIAAEGQEKGGDEQPLQM